MPKRMGSAVVRYRLVAIRNNSMQGGGIKNDYCNGNVISIYLATSIDKQSFKT